MVWRIVRILFGAIWVYLGVEKLVRINEFIGDIENYEILHDALATGAAHMIAVMEIVVGLSLITRLAYRGGLTAIMGMLTIFIAALSWAWARGLEISCGCTPWAATERTNYPLGITINVVMILFTALLFYIELRRPRHRFRGNKLKLAM